MPGHEVANVLNANASSLVSRFTHRRQPRARVQHTLRLESRDAVLGPDPSCSGA